MTWKATILPDYVVHVDHGQWDSLRTLGTCCRLTALIARRLVLNFEGFVLDATTLCLKVRESLT
jgi:hypothetical protein